MNKTELKIETFFKQFPTATYNKGDVLVRAGEEPEYFFYIERGAVKMSLTTEDGRSLMLHTFFPKSFFSLLSLIEENKNEYDFTTQLVTTLRKVPREELITFLKENSDVLFDLQTRLLRGLKGMLKRVEQASLAPAINQIASLLIYFSKHFSEPDSESKRLSVKITHQEIADWLGLSRENVSKQMKVLETENFITISDHFIEINNFEKLQQKAKENF